MENGPTKQVYEAIEEAYQYFNAVLFDGVLPFCMVVLQRKPKMMGYVSHNRWVNGSMDAADELAINPEYWLGRSLVEVFQTLVHEQCHVWQNHFGTPGRRGYHNREWANKMVAVGLMPSTTGKPGGRQTGESVSDYVLKDGMFLDACIAFVGSGYELPWLDRVGHSVEGKAEIYNDMGVKSDITSQDEKLAQLTKCVGENILKFSQLDDGMSSSGTQCFTTKKQTRMKYRCNGCLAQVWGKAALNIQCADCKNLFSLIA